MKNILCPVFDVDSIFHSDALQVAVVERNLAGRSTPGFALVTQSVKAHDGKADLTQCLTLLREHAVSALWLAGAAGRCLDLALAAQASGIPVIRSGAGHRQFSRNSDHDDTPDVLVDQIAHLALTDGPRSTHQLLREGFGADRVAETGALSLDAVLMGKPESIQDSGIVVVVRPEILDAVVGVAVRTNPNVTVALQQTVDWTPPPGVRVADLTQRSELIALLSGADAVITDCAAVAVDASWLGIPHCVDGLANCVPEAVEAGLAGTWGGDLSILADWLNNASAIDALDITTGFGAGSAAKRTVDALTAICERLDQDSEGAPDGPWVRIGYADDIPTLESRSSFSWTYYRDMLTQFKDADYEFISFPEAFRRQPKQPWCVLRHDIDFDVAKALEIARIEAEQNIRSTFFFMIRTDHYNLFSARDSKLLREILDLGHFPGLHFDVAAYPEVTGPEALRAAICREADMFGQWFEQPISSVSFHRPSPLLLEGDPDIASPYVHSYDRRLREIADYVSDSNGSWRHGAPLDREAFANRHPMHVLVHPLWWSETPSTAFETLMRFVDVRRDRDDASFAANCRTFRRGHIARQLDFDD